MGIISSVRKWCLKSAAFLSAQVKDYCLLAFREYSLTFLIILSFSGLLCSVFKDGFHKFNMAVLSAASTSIYFSWIKSSTISEK